MHRKGRKKRRGLLITTLAVPFAPSFAGELTGTWEGSFSCGRVDFSGMLIESDVWQKIDGAWKVVSLHYDEVQPEE